MTTRWTGFVLRQLNLYHLDRVFHQVICFVSCQAPLYKTNLRAGVLNTTGQSTNYILDVGLPTDEPPHFWILMATALCTMTNVLLFPGNLNLSSLLCCQRDLQFRIMLLCLIGVSCNQD